MPVIIRSPRSRPQGALAYYLARRASVWITAGHHRPPGRPAASGETFPPERNPR